MHGTGRQIFVLAYLIGVPQWIWMLSMSLTSSIACGNSARLLCNLANHPARSSGVQTVNNSNPSLGTRPWDITTTPVVWCSCVMTVYSTFTFVAALNASSRCSCEPCPSWCYALVIQPRRPPGTCCSWEDARHSIIPIPSLSHSRLHFPCRWWETKSGSHRSLSVLRCTSSLTRRSKCLRMRLIRLPYAAKHRYVLPCRPGAIGWNSR